MSTSSSTLAHEMGHYLNLIHTFGSFNGGQGSCHTDDQCLSMGDKICDTGTQDASTGWVSSSCTPESSCGSPDPIRNYVSAPVARDGQDVVEGEGRRERD